MGDLVGDRVGTLVGDAVGGVVGNTAHQQVSPCTVTVNYGTCDKPYLWGSEWAVGTAQSKEFESAGWMEQWSVGAWVRLTVGPQAQWETELVVWWGTSSALQTDSAWAGQWALELATTKELWWEAPWGTLTVLQWAAD